MEPATPVVAGQPRRAFLVSHTHWDREWYLPFNRFRVHLLEDGPVTFWMQVRPES